MSRESVTQKILMIIPEVKKGIIISVTTSVFYELIKFIPVILLKAIVDKLVAGQSDFTQLAYYIGWILLSYLSLVIMDRYIKEAEFLWMAEYEIAILRKSKRKLLDLHLSYHESYNTGMQVAKITKGSHKLAELFYFIFNEFIPTIVQLILTIALLAYEQWMLALIFILFQPAVIAITIYTSKKIQPFRKLHHKKHDEAVGELGESLFNISTVKDYVQEEEQFRKFNEILGQFLMHHEKRTKYGHKLLIWRDLLITLGRAGTLGLAVYFVIGDVITAGSLVLVYSLTERAFLSVFRLGRLHSYLEDAMESINRLAQLFKTEPEIKNLPEAEIIHKLEGKIEFDNVSFKYVKGSAALDNINLKIEPKKIVALVGRSGSGKSTFAKLLLRNYDVTGGQIKVDNKDIRRYKLQDYKKRIAVVSQNVEIFNRTIMENLLFANPKAGKTAAIAAAKKAYAHEFIEEFSEGYNTIVGEKGVRLSGGQKQRISIARALLKNPDVYIFDEATSSLDSESERYIQKSIFSIARQKTTIIIAHRLSTIQQADLIVVLDKGKIIEKGTYQELVKKKGDFYQMVKLQNIGEIRE